MLIFYKKCSINRAFSVIEISLQLEPKLILASMLFFRIILISIGLFVATYLTAQLNPEFLYLNGEQNGSISLTLTSLGATPTLANAPTDGLPFPSITPLGNNEYELVWETPSDYLGQSSSTIEYFDNGIIPGFTESRFTIANLTFKPSLIEIQNEVVLFENGSIIDVLSNDVGSESDLELGSLSYVSGGQASIVNNQIQFTFDDNSDFGYVGYIAQDAIGTGNEGIARIIKSQDATNQQLDVSLHNKEAITIYLGDSNLSLFKSPDNGLINAVSDIEYTYTPNTTYTGNDVAVFSTVDGKNVQINLQVVEKELRNTVVVDDYIETNINQTVVFNVLENDHKDVYDIVDHSPELSYNGNGEFSYTPDFDEAGGNVYYYKIFTGITFLTGKILISISDYEPIESKIHQFTVESGTNFIIEHNAPVGGYNFSVLSDPNHGIINILNSGSSVENCDTDIVVEESSIDYFAEPGYEGEDAFELEYCTSTGICHIVKIEINIVDNNTNCNCQVGCVWPGDFNNDGIVDLKDLMTFGYNIGDNGIARSQSSNQWSGNESEDWGYLAINGDHDLKHIDANGDGYISLNDAEEIENNFGQSNKLVPESAYALAEYPVTLSTDQTVIDSGEWLLIDVSLGSLEAPVIDFYGMTINFRMDQNLIDESSVIFEIDESSWATYDSPLKGILAQPEAGNINVGFTRLTSEPVSGFGKVGTVKMIVEDELDGFRSIDDFYDIHITFDKTAVYTHQGIAREVLSNTVTVTIDKSKNNRDKNETLNITTYPNPTSDYLQVESDQVVEQIIIYDLSGKIVSNSSPMDDAFTYSIPNDLNGLFLFKFISGEKVKVEKIYVVTR